MEVWIRRSGVAALHGLGIHRVPIDRTGVPLVSPDTRTASLNYDEQSLIWYLRAKTHPFHTRIDASEFGAFMNQPGPALCVANEESLVKIQLDPSWKTFDLSGYNFARWKLGPVTLFGLPMTLPVPQKLDLVTVIKRRNFLDAKQ